jgi:hypothetical protein
MSRFVSCDIQQELGFDQSNALANGSASTIRAHHASSVQPFTINDTNPAALVRQIGTLSLAPKRRRCLANNMSPTSLFVGLK